MNTDKTSKTPQIKPDGYKLLCAGHLDKGQHFQIRRNGKWYTVHAQVVEQMNDGEFRTGRGDFFTIAVSDKRMYAFHYKEKVLVPCT